MIPALLTRAKLSLDRGSKQAAMADLRRAASLVHTAAAHTDAGPERDALMESSRGVFDELTKLALARGAVREALGYQQMSGAWVNAGLPTTSFARDGHAGTVLQYALIDDTLDAWVEARGGVRFKRWTVTRRAIESDEDALLGSVSLSGDGAALREQLGRLFDVLVRPITEELPNDSGPLTIVENDDLISVPFAALWDTATHRYLVQDYPLRYAVSAGSSRAADAVPRTRGTRIGLIADPAFDRHLDPDLRPLPASRSEVEAISRLYDRPRALVGRDATNSAVSKLFRWAQIIHYAGHVEYDDGQPEASRLILAGRGDAHSDDDIRPRDIRTMDLRRVSLVVLSSCQSLPGGARHGEG
ncbi:MAG: CHAT domain-containing protein, partial [Gemmatimonadaceae bacterium]